MNSITINEEKYVKATDIARELGYTTDYVGQLCRSKKVDAQLVGRSWYVCESSIRDYKKNRYRSVKLASKKSIEQTLQTKDLDSKGSYTIGVHVDTHRQSGGTSADKLFYKHLSSRPAHTYFADDSDLIPATESSKYRTGKIEVSLDGARSVKIKARPDEYAFDTTELPEIKFSGALHVTEVTDDEQEKKGSSKVVSKKTREKLLSGFEKKLNTSELSKRKETKKQKVTSIKIRHKRPDSKKIKKNLPLEHNPNGIIGMTAGYIIDRNPEGGTLKVVVPSENVSVSTTFSSLIVLCAVATSVGIVSVLLGLQSVVLFTDTSIDTSYSFSFDIKMLKAAVSSAF